MINLHARQVGIHMQQRGVSDPPPYAYQYGVW